MADAVGLYQKVSEHTRINDRSSTTIDLVFSNADDCVVKVMSDWRITDHETLGIKVDGVCKINMPERKDTYTSWKNYSKERLQTILSNDATLSENATTMNDRAQALGFALASAVEQLTEKCDRSVTTTNPWFGPHLHAVKLQRDNSYKTFRLSRSVEDWERYKRLRNSYVRELRRAKDCSIQQEISDCSGDSKRLWKRLKDLIKPGGTASTDVIFEGESEAVPDEETAIRLNTFFIESVEAIHDSISSVSNPSLAAESETTDAVFSQFRQIDMQKLHRVVASLKDCSGVDNVTKRVLVDAMDVVGEKLLDIINRSLEQGVFPEAWKRSVVVPIPKVPNSSRAEDRRPINMLPIYEKVLETIVKEQLMEYVDQAGILIEEQSGFRKQHSCESALNLLLLKWKQSIEHRKVVLAVFVDLKRAFETIDRAKLIEVLQRYGISGTALEWFESYLRNRTQATRYRQSTSPAALVDLGVPQGSVIGPLLFILYVNDLKKILVRANVNLFADDTVIYIASDSLEESYEVMNSELGVFADWLKLRKLKLNVSKTKYMVVSTRTRNDYNGNIQIDGELVERVNAIKYLGVMLDEKLCFTEHVNYTIKKAARKFGVLCRISRYLSFDNKIMIYKTLIAPHFDYCASILFLATKQQRKRMQIVQNKAMRLILGCERLTPRVFMLDSLQWMSVRQRVEYNTLIFIFRLTNGMAPQYLSSTIVYGRDVHRYETRRAGDLRLLKFKKSCTQNSLFYQGYSLFNQLPDAAKRTNNLREFRELCKSFVRQRPLD